MKKQQIRPCRAVKIYFHNGQFKSTEMLAKEVGVSRTAMLRRIKANQGKFDLSLMVGPKPLFNLAQFQKRRFGKV